MHLGVVGSAVEPLRLTWAEQNTPWSLLSHQPRLAEPADPRTYLSLSIHWTQMCFVAFILNVELLEEIENAQKLILFTCSPQNRVTFIWQSKPNLGFLSYFSFSGNSGRYKSASLQDQHSHHECPLKPEEADYTTGYPLWCMQQIIWRRAGV